MIDFGDDTAGECFIVVHGGHRFPRCSATFDRLNNIRLMPVNPRRGPAVASVLSFAYYRIKVPCACAASLSPMQSPQTQLLSQDVDDEQWNVHGIPPPKTTRVGAKAEGPFQPGSLQVSRRLRDDSSVDIERGTNSD
jgi:hypothetical protein